MHPYDELIATDHRLHTAGERVPAGLYRRLDSGGDVRLTTDGYLPASLDGRVACYVRVSNLWREAGDAPEQAAA